MSGGKLPPRPVLSAQNKTGEGGESFEGNGVRGSLPVAVPPAIGVPAVAPKVNREPVSVLNPAFVDSSPVEVAVGDEGEVSSGLERPPGGGGGRARRRGLGVGDEPPKGHATSSEGGVGKGLGSKLTKRKKATTSAVAADPLLELRKTSWRDRLVAVGSGVAVAGAGLLFAVGVFNDFSEVDRDVEAYVESLREAKGEVVEKEFDPNSCPSDQYVVPVNSDERSRSEMRTDGLVCLDSPYILRLDGGVQLRVEHGVYNSLNLGDVYEFDGEAFAQETANVRSVAVSYPNVGLKYGLIGAGVGLLGLGSWGFFAGSKKRARRGDGPVGEVVGGVDGDGVSLGVRF